MSLEWARSRAIENSRRERERARIVQGADAPQIGMLYPVELTFWAAAPEASDGNDTHLRTAGEKIAGRFNVPFSKRE